MRRYFAKVFSDSPAGAVERLRELTVRQEAGRLLVTLDGRTHAVDALPLEGGALGLLLDGQSFAAEFEERGDRLRVLLRGSVFSLELLDERRSRMRAETGKLRSEGPQRILAPMPGKVVRVLVAVGDAVEEGQGLLVIEAMKMENELKAARAGTVKEIFVAEGMTVEGSTPLCVVA